MNDILKEKEKYCYVVKVRVRYDDGSDPFFKATEFHNRELALEHFEYLVELWLLNVRNSVIINKKRDKKNKKKYKIRNNLVREDIVITLKRRRG